MSELVHSKSSFFGKVLPIALLAGVAGLAGWALWSEEAPVSSAQPGPSEAVSPLADSGAARDAGEMSPRAPSADDGALGGLTPFAQLVARSAVWDLPAHARVPGVHWARLADSPEDWVNSLPPEQRAQAQDFLDRNGQALAFESREQLAWLLDNGFPSLEEVIAFAQLSDNLRSSCLRLPCTNGKLATLQADAILARLEDRIRELEASSGTGFALSRLQEIDPALAEGVYGELLKVDNLLGGAIDAGSVLYTQHLRLRRDELIASPIEERRQVATAVATQVMRFCGDVRLEHGYHGNGSNHDAVASTLRAVAGYSQQNLTAICGPMARPVTPRFIPKSDDALVAKRG